MKIILAVTAMLCAVFTGLFAALFVIGPTIILGAYTVVYFVLTVFFAWKVTKERTEDDEREG